MSAPAFDSELIGPLDLAALRASFANADPVPFLCVDDFLRPEFAAQVEAAYPSFDEALSFGRSFRAVNENRKVQFTEPARFPEPVRRLHELLASPAWLDALSWVTGIPKLLADPELYGGGMHLMAPGAHLDVHVDFNLIEERALHRRLNILVFLNRGWSEDWGGQFELWDRDVRECRQRFAPELNRCVVFETSRVSFHGVKRVSPTAPRDRRSFAAYYYTEEPPSGFEGRRHSTIFRARPEERWKRSVLMPAEKLWRLAVTRPASKLAQLLRRR